MGEHRRGDAADRNEAQDRELPYSHFQVQIDGIHHSRSTSRRKTVREARVRTAAIVERDARMGGGVASPGSSPSSVWQGSLDLFCLTRLASQRFSALTFTLQTSD